MNLQQQVSDRDSAEILIVDDDELFRWTLARGFSNAGMIPYEADALPRAVAQVREHPTLTKVVLDLRLSAESGLDVLRALLAERPELRCIMFSGYCSTVVAIEALRMGALNCLPKSTSIAALVAELATDGPRPPLEEIEVPTLAKIEWEHIQRVLHDCDGNISLAARKLGIHRQSLQRKLRRNPPSR